MLTRIIEKDPMKGAIIVSELEIWSVMLDQASLRMKQSAVLCKCFTSILLYACFRLHPKHRELPSETDALIELLQVAFVRGSEDFSIIGRIGRAKERMKFFERHPLEEEIDSNCLWAIL